MMGINYCFTCLCFPLLEEKEIEREKEKKEEKEIDREGKKLKEEERRNRIVKIKSH